MASSLRDSLNNITVTFIPSLSEDLTKFREELDQWPFTASLTGTWIGCSEGILPHDYIAVTKQARPSRGKPLTEETEY